MRGSEASSERGSEQDSDNVAATSDWQIHRRRIILDASTKLNPPVALCDSLTVLEIAYDIREQRKTSAEPFGIREGIEHASMDLIQFQDEWHSKKIYSQSITLRGQIVSS